MSRQEGLSKKTHPWEDSRSGLSGWNWVLRPGRLTWVQSCGRYDSWRASDDAVYDPWPVWRCWRGRERGDDIFSLGVLAHENVDPSDWQLVASLPRRQQLCGPLVATKDWDYLTRDISRSHVHVHVQLRYRLCPPLETHQGRGATSSESCVTLDYLWPLTDDPELLSQGSARTTPRRHFPLALWKGRKFSPSACS